METTSKKALEQDQSFEGKFPFEAVEYESITRTATPKIILNGYNWRLDTDLLPTTDGHSTDGLLWSNGGIICLNNFALPTTDPGHTSRLWSSGSKVVLSGFIEPEVPSVIRLANKSIASVSQTTDLSVYIDGGSSELADNSEVWVYYSGGVAARTCSHTFTGTGYTINGAAITTYTGYTYGWFRLQLDKANDDFRIIDSDWIWEQTSSGALALNTTFTFAHGLGSIPKQYEVYIVCTSTDLGYAVGDELDVSSTPNYTRSGVGEYVHATYADATNVGLIVGNSAGFYAVNKSTRGEGTVTVSKWKVRVRYK
jgi:hypothetical protein